MIYTEDQDKVTFPMWHILKELFFFIIIDKKDSQRALLLQAVTVISPEFLFQAASEKDWLRLDLKITQCVYLRQVHLSMRTEGLTDIG